MITPGTVQRKCVKSEDYCVSTFLEVGNTKYYSFFFLEGRGGRAKKRERNINVWLPLAHPLLGKLAHTTGSGLTGNRTGGPLVHRPALSPLSHTSHGKILFSYKHIYEYVE